MTKVVDAAMQPHHRRRADLCVIPPRIGQYALSVGTATDDASDRGDDCPDMRRDRSGSLSRRRIAPNGFDWHTAGRRLVRPLRWPTERDPIHRAIGSPDDRCFLSYSNKAVDYEFLGSGR